MIPTTISDELINKLKVCKRVYFHSNCPDGIISRNLLHYLRSNGLNDFDGTVEYVSQNPGKPAEVVEGAVFVDLSPIPEQYEAFLKAGAVILDHHNTVLPLVEQFKDEYPDQLLFGETDKVESGAWLVYLCLDKWMQTTPFVSRNTSHFRIIAKMIAIGDCWDKSNPEAFENARSLGKYIGLYGNDYTEIPGMEFISRSQEYGRLTRDNTARTAKTHIMRQYKGLNIAFFNTREGISDLAEVAREKFNADLVVSWYQQSVKNDGEVTSFSLRSNDNFDCGAFAKNFKGGGGHIHAAGFQIPGLLSGIDWFLASLETKWTPCLYKANSWNS